MSGLNFPYPFDPAGNKVSNKIVGETHVISPPAWKDYSFIIPNLAPFFRESLKIKNVATNEYIEEGIDWMVGHRFIDASRATAKDVYGSILLFDKNFAGVLELEYQTLGGEWTIDGNAIAEILINKQLNPRTTSWEQVVNTPHQFPVIDHEWNLIDMVGMSDVRNAILQIAQAIISNGNPDVSLDQHVNDKNNPHEVTKAQVGLELVNNGGWATLEEVIEGLSQDSYINVRRLRQGIEEWANKYTDLHKSDKENPHEVTKAQVGLEFLQNYPIANTAVLEAGVSNFHYVTVGGVKLMIELFGNVPLTQHIEDKENPHEVTKRQVGLEFVENHPMANSTEAINGDRSDRYSSPANVKEHVDSRLTDYYSKAEVDDLINNLRDELLNG